MARTHSATVEGLREYARQFDREMAQYADWNLRYVQSQLRGCGTIAVQVAAAYTPPNRGVSYQSAVKKNTPGVLNLRAHIAEDIGGGEDASAFTYGVPIHLKDGTWGYRPTSPAGTATGRRHLPPTGLVVPTSRPRGFRSSHVGVEWLKSNTTLAPASNGGREVRKRNVKAITFAPASTIKRMIKAEQKKVGRLLSGWAPAAAAFKHGVAPGGLYPSLGGKGRVFFRGVSNEGVYGWKIVNNEFYRDRNNPMLRDNVQEIIGRLCSKRLSMAVKNAGKHKIR